MEANIKQQSDFQQKKYIPAGKVRYLSSAVLISGLPYQRQVSQRQVNKLIRHWDSKFLTPLVVSLRDGKYYLIDGQHRLAAMRKMNGGKEVMLPCIIHTGLTYKKEAEMYVLLDKSKIRVKLVNSVKAKLEFGSDAAILDIDQRIDDAGFTWALDKPTGAAYEIIPTQPVIRAYKKLGGPAFSRMLGLLAGTWHGSQGSLKTAMFYGLTLFLKTYETEIDDYLFIHRLFDVNPLDILQKAKEDFTTDYKALRTARVLRKQYNDHAGRKKLPYRFKD